MMAAVINPNIHLANEHTAIIADSGSGKSGALAKLLPARGVRLIVWDPNNDHVATAFDRLGDFCRALAKAEKANSETGAGYRLSYTGGENIKAFDLWCHAVNSVLDGNKKTYIVIEELAGVSPSVGKARPPLQKMFNQARKFGGVIYFTTQRPQEIPKTAFSQCKLFYIGIFSDTATRKYIAGRLGLGDQMELFNQVDIGKFIFTDKNNALNQVKLHRFFTKK